MVYGLWFMVYGFCFYFCFCFCFCFCFFEAAFTSRSSRLTAQSFFSPRTCPPKYSEGGERRTQRFSLGIFEFVVCGSLKQLILFRILLVILPRIKTALTFQRF